MMWKLVKSFLMIALVATCMPLATSPPTASGIGQVLPPGNWSLGCRPSLEAISRGDGVVVYSVSTSAAKGLSVWRVKVKNRTPKNVVAVKLKWRLFRLDSADEDLLTGETPLLGAPLEPNEHRVIEYPVVCQGLAFPLTGKHA